MQTLQNDEHIILATEIGLEPLVQVRTRRQCEDHINRQYPVWQQLNILRSGSIEEQARMGKFIDACRDWSNGEQPDPAELERIQP
ncbi:MULTISPECIES: hypothetical protein [Chromobacterium]|uniref:hypothetical protein n=1 Tax=Chromobacterium TaxID=535 RepID=UPI0018893098|nr:MULTISPECIES: hypothetical protein [Chromobacterium]QOZ83188.1 hypothetical protein DXT74_09005 [Chromobacterium sp. Rain0013]WON83288.1 hypothetical protein OK026_19465 [Chromobacterium haemolyticum]